jgi:hypothetical protein
MLRIGSLPMEKVVPNIQIYPHAKFEDFFSNGRLPFLNLQV